MKSAKVTTLIAAVLFLLAGAGSIPKIPELNSILMENAPGTYTNLYAVPVVDFMFAAACVAVWGYLLSREKRGKPLSYAHILGIVLLGISIVLPTALTIWYILLPIYNLGSTAS